LRRSAENLNRLGSYDTLLTISEATRQALLALLSVSPDRVATIGTASDGRFFVPDRSDPMPADSRALFQKLGITEPFVLSVGTMEYDRRDNLWGIIEAFAMLPVELRQAHQLVLTYNLTWAGRKRAQERAVDRGVADRLVITDRIADKGLRALYQRCAAFVSLTSYEDLGLPILEAMHCGAPVVVGNSPAQIEVVGDAGLFFDVTHAAELAEGLVQVLSDSGRTRHLREQALVRARPFHWDDTADKVLDVLTRSHSAIGNDGSRGDYELATR
jgi:glycosyltransferase involved in cell wall biosynthesis